MKVYVSFLITGIAGNPFSVFNSTDLEIPELFNFTSVADPADLAIYEMFGSGDDVNEWPNSRRRNSRRRKSRRKFSPSPQRLKNDKLNHPNNDCSFPDIIVHAGDIIDGISINDPYGNDDTFGNDGGSPYCINLSNDEIVTSLVFGYHTHSWWATWNEKYDGHLCDFQIVTNRNTFGPFASWHGQCGNHTAIQIETTLKLFLQSESAISSKGMLLIET